MFDALVRHWMQAGFRDLAILGAGLVVLVPVAWALHGRRRLSREVTDGSRRNDRIAAMEVMGLLMR